MIMFSYYDTIRVGFKSPPENRYKRKYMGPNKVCTLPLGIAGRRGGHYFLSLSGFTFLLEGVLKFCMGSKVTKILGS